MPERWRTKIFPKSITQKNAKTLRTRNFTFLEKTEAYLHREDERDPAMVRPRQKAHDHLEDQRVEEEEEPEGRILGIEENCAGFLSVSPSGNRVLSARTPK